MPAKAKQRPPHEGSLFPRDVLAANIRAQRGWLGLTQKDLSERMSSLQHVWSRPTVVQVEKSARPVSADELVGLAIALSTSVISLLQMPVDNTTPIDVGVTQPLSTEVYYGLLGGRRKLSPRWDGNESIQWRKSFIVTATDTSDPGQEEE